MTARIERVARFAVVVGVLALEACLAAFATPAPQGAANAPGGPHELYEGLNALRVVSSQVYYVKELHLRRDIVRISLSEGKLAFLGRFDGRLTGAVFTGHGHVLGLPRDHVEKQQLARFLSEPLLDQGFSRAYFRFTDDAAEELLKQLQKTGAQASDQPAFADEWNPAIANLNPGHSLRILMDWLAQEPRPYFYAGLVGDVSGPFDVLLDDRRHEQMLIGQPHWVRGAHFYDVWTSLRRAGAPDSAGAPPFVPVRYAIETTILADRSLEGTTSVTLKAQLGGERVVPLELSRYLSVQSAEDAAGRPLAFFQNEAVHRHEIAERGNEALLIVLPAAVRAGEEIRLRIRYRGSVISDAGNGVFFVGDRGSWYPHAGSMSTFAPFELTLRWPHKLQLVATGRKLEEGEEGEFRSGRWRTEAPATVVGFNLGEYASETVDAGDFKVDLYANRHLEEALLRKFRQRGTLAPLPPYDLRLPRPDARGMVVVTEPPPSPADVLKQLAREIADAARFYERFAGPFPFERLQVAQIPGTIGQGWPGLVYLSTLSFLSPQSQERAGLSERAQEDFSELMPYHEVAHQWWGNLVGWNSYRDQWIHEGLCNYLALLHADSKKTPDRALNNWLVRFRKDLTEKVAGQELPAEEAGPLTLGYRLRSSRSPEAYDRVVYGKGAWVFHMLRMMLREPASKDPDARFARLLRSLTEAYRYRALTTEDLQRAVEAVMTPAMELEGSPSLDWFFDQWVRSTGIPRYSAQFHVKPQGNAFVVRGILRQSSVPESFLASVPIYAVRPGGKPFFLGHVNTSGAETRFQFPSRFAPKRLLIDPRLTLLCLTE